MFARPLRIAVMTAALSAAAVLPSLAEDAKTGDPVVAVVNGREIHRSTLIDAYQHSRLNQAPMEAVYDQLLSYVIAGQLLLTEARKENLADDPKVKEAVKDAENNILEQTYLSRKIDAAITDDKIKAQYDEMVKNAPPKEEVHARHILVDSEDAAKQVIADLKAGAKFEDEAKAKSKDPSAAQNGGDLGFFSKDEMVPEFADAAFKMKVGEISETPVKSQFGWHVIQVIERRTAPPPTLDQARENIVAELRNQEAQTVIENLQKSADIKRFNLDGSPMAAAPADKAPAGDQKPADQKPADQKQ